MTIVKTYDDPTDIFIIGSCNKNEDRDFSITDDESTLKILSGKEEFYINTEGHVSILTHEELIEYIQSGEHDIEFEEDAQLGLGDYREFVRINNFSGDIILSFTGDDNVRNDIDVPLDDYVNYADEFRELDNYEDLDPTIIIPSKFTVSTSKSMSRLRLLIK